MLRNSTNSFVVKECLQAPQLTVISLNNSFGQQRCDALVSRHGQKTLDFIAAM